MSLKMKEFPLSLNSSDLDNISDLKVIGKLILRLLMSLRVSQKYGPWLLNY